MSVQKYFAVIIYKREIFVYEKFHYFSEGKIFHFLLIIHRINVAYANLTKRNTLQKYYYALYRELNFSLILHFPVSLV